MDCIRVGISPCPNDTFAFYHLLEKRQDLPFEIDLVIADVEELNRKVKQGGLDISKVSFHLFGHVLDRYRLLRSGSALGRGCGPLILTSKPCSVASVASATTALPGMYTTASMLFRLFMAESGFRHVDTVHMLFSEIPHAVAVGNVHAGVVIHETRFTFGKHGLHCLQDLGQWWENSTGQPIPLGGIVAKRSLAHDKVELFDAALRESIEYAYAHVDEALAFAARYAQEMAPEVMKQHIALYVNEFTADIGEEGMAAVAYMLETGRRHGILPDIHLQELT